MGPRKKQAFNIDGFMDEALAESRRVFGEDLTFTAAEGGAKQLVVPIPPISVRWLIGASGWPLSRFTQSAGPYASFKSSFGDQLADWYLKAGGVVAKIDTENKSSASLTSSILAPEFSDINNPLHGRCHRSGTHTIDEWNRMVNQRMTALEELSKKSGKPSFPSLWIVDSMMGVDSATASDKFKTEGVGAGRTFSDASLILSQFFRSVTGLMVGYPVTLHMVHHEHPHMSQANATRRTGGVAPDYYATLDIQFKTGPYQTVLGKADEFNRVDYSARTVRLRVRKNSMGADGKEMVTLFKWIYVTDPETGAQVQRSWWDWSGSTSDVLLKNNAALERSGLFTLKKTSKNVIGELYWVDQCLSPDFADLLPDKEETALPAAEFGAMVESLPTALRDRVERALNITQYPEFIGSPPELASDGLQGNYYTKLRAEGAESEQQ